MTVFASSEPFDRALYAVVYEVSYAYEDPMTGMWRQSSARYHANNRDAHKAVEKRFEADMRGVSHHLIRVVYQ